MALICIALAQYWILSIPSGTAGFEKMSRSDLGSFETSTVLDMVIDMSGCVALCIGDWRVPPKLGAPSSTLFTRDTTPLLFDMLVP